MSQPAERLAAARAAALSIGISCAGGAGALALGLPAPWLVGGAAAVTAAALFGVPIGLPSWLRDAGFVIIGMSMGSSVAPDTLALLGQWPATMAALFISVAAVVAATAWLLATVFKFDRQTALLASTPGHASFIQALALSGLGDARQIAVVQSIRILTLVIAVPLVIRFAAPGALNAGPLGAAPMEWTSLAWLAVVCAGAGWLALRLKVPAGFVIGSMVAATAARLGGLTEGAVPAVVLVPGFVIIAALIGSRFAGVTRPVLRRSLAAGLVATSIAIALSALAAWLASLVVGISFGEIWIAIAPGGLDAMAVMGLSLGYDPAFVMGHHAARLFILALAMPTILAAMRRRSSPAGAAR